MKGYVALTTILIIVPLLLLTGMDSVYRSLTTVLVGKMNYDYQILKIDGESCLEESVYRVKRNHNLTGNVQIPSGEVICDVNISNKAGVSGVKIIDITATDSNGIKIFVKKELNTNTNPFELINIE